MFDFSAWYGLHFPHGGSALPELCAFAEAVQTYPGNLTSTRNRQEFDLLHLVDSLLPLVQLPEVVWQGRWMDLGSGPGLPGLPLALVATGMHMTLLDARARPLEFVRDFLAGRDGPPLRTLVGRAEEVGRDPDHRERYDGLVVRAVDTMGVLAELGLPLLRPGGTLIAYKGRDPRQELRQSIRALRELGGQVRACVEYRLPQMRHQRSLVVIEKVAPTPERYPRRVGIPRKRPLRG